MSLFGTLTAIGSAIASGVGAVSGGIASGVTAGLGAAGMATGAGSTAAAIGSAVGTGATSAAIGSGLGAATSAAMGKDPGQGALMGAAGGALTGGLGSALGSAGSSAGGITGSAGQAATAAQPAVSTITQGVASPGFQQAATGIQGAAEVAAAEPSVSAITQGVASPGFQQASQAAAANAGSGGLGSLLGSDTAKSVGIDLAKEGIGAGINEIQRLNASREGARSIGLANMQAQQEDADMKNRTAKMYASSGGLGGGKGLGMNRGGGVKLQEGQFIIPADVVSALGNGSTKAGANFLNDFFSQS